MAIIEVRKQKSALRKQLLLKRARQKEKDLVRKSNDIEKKLFSVDEFKDAKSVMFYVARKDEVRTGDMIRRCLGAGKKVIVPSLRVDKKRITPSLLFDYDNDLEEGVFGILEPKVECIRSFPVEEIGIVLVPGVAFDMYGGRLGFGGGYYDKLLSQLGPQIQRWGLAFELQLVEKLPLTDRDVPVQKIVTEKRIIACQPSA